MINLIRVENSRSRPRSSVTLATTATNMAGTAAITANKPTICTCNRAAARPRRRACTTSHTSWPMMPTSRTTVAKLIRSSVLTTESMGAIGVRSAKTTNVVHADSIASAAASGPSTRTARLVAGAAISAGVVV
jgi:hypothetical protein